MKNENFNKKLGGFLREIRVLRRTEDGKRLSLKNLGKKLPKPVTAQQMHKYELGIDSMSLVKFYEICEILKVDPIDVLKEVKKL